jgi:purine-binding chemotaxis protein CheW
MGVPASPNRTHTWRLVASPKEIFVASDELIMRQRDALGAQTKSSAQRPDTQYSSSSDDVRESQRGSRASAAIALQSHLAQISKPDNASLAEVLGEQYLVFSLLEREFAFKAEYIQGVERLVDVTPIPNVAPWIRGVINLRGSIASVVDLRSFLDMEHLPYNPRTRLLSVHYNEMVICLVVDGVSEMVPIPQTAITNSNVHQNTNLHWGFPYTSGVAVLDNRVIVLVDAARLLFSDKMQRYEALQ